MFFSQLILITYRENIVLKLDVDHEISLVLMHKKMSKQLFLLINKNIDHLTSWENFFLEVNDLSLFNKYVEHILVDFAYERSLPFVIQYKKEIIGMVGIQNINYVLRKGEMFYWLSKEYCGKGLAKICCEFIISYFFDEFYPFIRKIEILTAERNIKSRGLAERLGFNLEGVISSNIKVKDKLFSLAIYGFQK